MPWSLMFLLGGGFAISRGSVASCMAKRVGEALIPLRYLPPIAILIIVCFFEGFITEFTSNVGVANITLPVIAQMVNYICNNYIILFEYEAFYIMSYIKIINFSKIINFWRNV